MKQNFSIIKSIQVIFFLSIPLISLAQSDVLNTIKEKASTNQSQQFEKIFVHTDKQAYLPGEILWFKIYNVSSLSNQLNKTNKLAYVEVLNHLKEPILQAKVPLTNGLGSGSFYLPSSIISDKYLFRAYTEPMKAQNNLLFEKEIAIINVNKLIVGANKSMKYDLQFFPEGGQIVDGIPTKVAFKLTHQLGRGVDFEGVVVDQNDNIIKEIKSLKFGIGSFNLAPAPDRKYKVKIYLKNGQIIDQPLPPILAQGYGLNVTKPTSNQLKIKVAASKNLEGRAAYIIIHSKKGGVSFAEALTLKYSATEITVDEQRLDEGISEITLFNENQQPVSERLYFKRPKKSLSLELTSNNTTFKPRKLVNLDLQARDGNLKPIIANLSLSVYQTDSLQQQVGQTGIFDYLWLSSELKGKVESPDYYLNTNTTESNLALDHVMLSHGWRKFNSNFTAPTTELAHNGNLIIGKVTLTNGEPVADVLTYLSLPGKNINLYVGKTNTNGLVSFDVKNYYGLGELVFQTNDPRRADFNLQLLNPFYMGLTDMKLTSLEVGDTPSEELLAANIAVQVQNAFAQTSSAPFNLPNISTIPFFYKADKTYNLDDYTRFRTMEEVLKEYIAQSSLRKSGENYHLFLLDANKGFNFDKEPLILFDGIPNFNTNKIVAYDPLKIKSISLINKRYYYGPLVANGIISFTTNSSDAPPLELDAKGIIISYDGLQAKREFYAPKYDLEEQVSSRMPDFRTLLHWVPDLNTNVDGKVNLKFYTSDVEGNFKIVINGLTTDGLPASYQKDFKVIK